MQADLFDVTSMQTAWERYARATDPWTSQDAAERVSEFRDRVRDMILWALKEFGPGTQHEIAGRVDLTADQIHKRLPEMQRLGLIRLTGDSRLGPSGRACRVWSR